MSVMSTLPRGRALTAADIEAMPDDGRLYELIDGVLVVSPPPEWRHGAIALALWRLLDDHVPDHLRVLTAPSAVVIDESTWVEPDVFVAAKADFGRKWLERSPALAVEVVSPHNRLHDLNTKFARYERAGIPSYWVVYPDELRLVAWELDDGRYVEVADVGPGEPWTASQPFAVTVDPATLLD